MQIPPNLLKTFNTSLNELDAEAALIALKEDGYGPFQSQAHRGLAPREIQALIRAISHPEAGFEARAANGQKPFRIRMTAPAHRSLLGIPLRCQRRVYGALVIGRKERAAFSEKDRRRVEETAGELEAALAKSGLFPAPGLPPTPVLPAAKMRDSGRAREGREPALAEPALAPVIGTEDLVIESLMAEIRALIPYDRALVTRYEEGTKTLDAVLSHTPGHIDWRQGQTLTLDGSAAGWVIRHKKPRLDRDLASTQGRFLDYKELYKDKFKTALVLPLRRGQDFIGTIALSSRMPDLYNPDMARAASALLGRLAALLPTMSPRPAQPPAGESGGPPGRLERPSPTEFLAGPQDTLESRELLLRHERQAAIRELTGFLEQEIQRPLTKIRLEMEEVTEEAAGGEAVTVGTLQRIEKAYRDLTRIEAILNEVLDVAKPLELHPRVIRIQDVLESAVEVITGELERNRITVTRQFSEGLPAVRADEGKLQQVFLSILKNALEAMAPGGHIALEAVPHKGSRGRHEIAITVKNDGAPIPTEHIGKIFEPGFTTKEAGTGLGLSSVKKIIEEHHGQISIASGPGQGTAVVIRLPAHAPARPRGRGRRRPHRR